MEHNCTNCSQTITGSFCSSCGQKKYHRIDRKYIWDETQYMLLHTNKGFLYSVKNILKNPGKTAREFIDGKRVNHYKPLLLAFVLSGIAAFISFKIIGFKELMQNYYSAQHVNSNFITDFLSFTASYNSVIMLVLIPFFAFFTRLVFRKWGHNYYEHIVMNAYILSYYNLITILFLSPVLYLLKGNLSVFASIAGYSNLLVPPVLVWFFKAFYAGKSLGKIIGKVLLTLLLVMLAFVVLFVLTGFVLAMLKGPEAMKYIQPH